ncbi:hypothetical protein [Streptomyces sp. NPDC052042]
MVTAEAALTTGLLTPTGAHRVTADAPAGREADRPAGGESPAWRYCP